jgi:Mn-dependent DtxR family transcriptional regulator
MHIPDHRPSRLTGQQLRALLALHDTSGNDGATSAAVADVLGIKTMSAATRLAHLRDRGLVKRSTMRNMTSWCLTESGKNLVDGVGAPLSADRSLS